MACCLPVAGYCDTAGTASPEACTPRQADMRSLLNAYSALADEHFTSVLRGLRTLASTSEVKSGKWAAMKGLLAQFRESGTTAAAVWYARPDGGYYTVKKGLSGENLADRPYFPGLLAGKEVVGDLVISRSTGKRAAVFAVPVKKGNKITGAVGVSVSVDETSLMLNKKMALPQNFVFYALDTKGRVSLHWKPELLFAYPSDLGSPTLNDAVKTMMSGKEGEVIYEFQGRKTIYFKKSPLTGWVYALGVVSDSGQPGR
jgi:hypothetical protein